VLSPSTRSVDLLLKRGVYAESGVAAYWLVDPAVPSVCALRLADGDYVEVGCAEGGQALELAAPFPVRVVPQDLLDL
jgi:Uma2 family endonuclease